MQPRVQMESDSNQEKLEVVVAVFDDHVDASRAAASLRGPGLKIQKISLKDQTTPSQMPDIVYEDINEVTDGSASQGAIIGGAIGAGSGLVFLGVPGLNVAAPIVGFLAGAWIGSIAGIAEADRALEVPDSDAYKRMLAEGKSFVVIGGNESLRWEYEQKLDELGAEAVFQHPPLGHLVRKADGSESR